MKNYLIYPCKTMNITQSYTGNTSHSPHNTGTPKDYPWDEACEGSGRSPMYCPCDEMVVKRIYTKGTNTIWLESTSEVLLADGTRDFASIMAEHPNDSDFAKLKVGKKFKRGDFICYEGTDGNASGNHFHFSVGKGKIKGNGWVQNSKGKWVLNCTGGAQKPETMFYIDREFTTLVKKTQGLMFKDLPKEDDFLPEKGYLEKGDNGKSIEMLCDFFANNVKGSYFGDYLEACVKVFQKQNGLETDGKVTEMLLKKLKEKGFKKGE